MSGMKFYSVIEKQHIFWYLSLSLGCWCIVEQCLASGGLLRILKLFSFLYFFNINSHYIIITSIQVLLWLAFYKHEGNYLWSQLKCLSGIPTHTHTRCSGLHTSPQFCDLAVLCQVYRLHHMDVMVSICISPESRISASQISSWAWCLALLNRRCCNTSFLTVFAWNCWAQND